VLGSAAMTAWDLFLDPQMVGEGYWAWARRGLYRGIPLSNFGGWFLTGLGIMALFEVVLPVARTGPDRHDVRLVGQYGYMSVMQTLGFARYFRDPLVAVVGGLGMLPFAAAAATQLTRRAA
ncbi:MAG: carotenoid biosynthesis protein, partial [Ilumatobacter sp.]|nr:carotenoid biosynthesis protein [Ilumatobacter sp.]